MSPLAWPTDASVMQEPSPCAYSTESGAEEDSHYPYGSRLMQLSDDAARRGSLKGQDTLKYATT